MRPFDILANFSFATSKMEHDYYQWKVCTICVKVFTNGPCKICGRHPLKSFTWSILECVDPYMSCLASCQLQLKLLIFGNKEISEKSQNFTEL